MSETSGEPTSKVLFVDDEESILNSLRRLTMDEDFEVLTAASGDEALELLKASADIGLIVSDQRMPGLSGVDFLERAQTLSPDALRIMLTGYADLHATVDAINKGGAYRYITKPWNDDEFLQTIREALLRYRLLRENKTLTATVNRQNEELKEWNTRLKDRVLEQTARMREQNEELNLLNGKLRLNYNNVILAFSGLLELRGKGMRSHSRNVRDLSVNAAKAMELSDEEVETIRVAALLHDIGKIGIDDHILGKSVHGMTDEELQLYRQHPVRGQTAIDSIEDLRTAGVFIRHHHERYDGNGFPDGLKGDDIPLGARIIAMADFIDKTMVNVGGENAQEIVLGKVTMQLGITLDSRLLPHFKKLINYLCFDKLGGRLKASVREEEVNPLNLREGLVLSRDLNSGTGVLLLNKGAALDETMINSIQRYYSLDPPATGVFVLVQR